MEWEEKRALRARDLSEVVSVGMMLVVVVVVLGEGPSRLISGRERRSKIVFMPGERKGQLVRLYSLLSLERTGFGRMAK